MIMRLSWQASGRPPEGVLYSYSPALSWPASAPGTLSVSSAAGRHPPPALHAPGACCCCRRPQALSVTRPRVLQYPACVPDSSASASGHLMLPGRALLRLENGWRRPMARPAVTRALAAVATGRSPDRENGPRWVQVLRSPSGSFGTVWVVVAGQRLLFHLWTRALLQIPVLHHLQPLEDLRRDLRVACRRVAVGMPIGHETLEDLLPVGLGLRLRHAQGVCDGVQRCSQCRVALRDHLPARHLPLAVVVVVPVRRVDRLAQRPAVDAVEGRLEDVLAGGGEHAASPEQSRSMGVLLRYCHIVCGVVVVDFHVIERTTAKVHIQLRVVEEHFDDFTGTMLRSHHQRRDLLKKLEPRV
mmetsp:Transcript_16954/g.49651  ORF Transcript_16954/g.49651 Transcript_16954/m.49651 type:complete len:357 (-) Transcript_16954:1850-2920(-)